VSRVNRQCSKLCEVQISEDKPINQALNSRLRWYHPAESAEETAVRQSQLNDLQPPRSRRNQLSWELHLFTDDWISLHCRVRMT